MAETHKSTFEMLSFKTQMESQLLPEIANTRKPDNVTPTVGDRTPNSDIQKKKGLFSTMAGND
jgi:hypothetical protein